MMDVEAVPNVRANDRDLILALDIASVIYADPKTREWISDQLNLNGGEFRRFYARIEAHLRLYQSDAC